MGKATKKQLLETSDGPSIDNSPVDGRADLDQLRNILFGNKSQAIEDRLDELEKRLESVRRDAKDELRKESVAISGDVEKVQADLSDKFDTISKELADVRKELGQLRNSAAKDLTKTKKELSDSISALNVEINKDIDNLREDLIERLLTKQAESRQRDDALRQELLSISAWLDSSKTSRTHLGELLVHMGQQIQENEGSDSIKDLSALESNDESG